VVEEMAIAAGLPKPKVYVVDDQDPTRSPRARRSSSCIAVTTGLLAVVNREELQA